MACIRKRRGKWVADWRDGAGIRRWKTFDAKVEAEDFLDIERQKARQWSQPTMASNILFDAYTKHWLALITSTVKPRTADGYRNLLDDHLLPVFGNTPVRQLHRGRIKSLLSDKLAAGLARNTVRNIHACLRALLRSAVDDGLLVTNPAEKLGRQLRLVTSHTARQEQIKAMTLAQRQAFLASAKEEPRWYPLFATIAGTGLRVGEALALQWDDVDFTKRQIRVARAFSRKRLETPKAGHGRTVDISAHLADILLSLAGARQAEKALYNWQALPPWVFCSESGTPLDDGNTRRAMARILKASQVPTHFSPHCLRHTYASLLLQAGESPVYVQRQLGHASIQLTVDTYGKWLPTVNHGAVDRLDGVTR